MIGLFLAILLIILLILFVLKIIFDHTDFQTWLNILIVTVILFTVVLSVYIILSKVNTTSKPVKTKVTKEETLEKKSKKPEAKPQKDVSEMSDEELSIMIAEKYLTLKTDYEKQHKGEDSVEYAKQQIMDEYGLTEEEWEALYNKFVQNGYLDKAAQNLNLGTDYLIKTK
ncbi:MAG: hypothetical protein J6S61_04535 [Elusimicrobiaceae bacterium]|nr:hypothetical protein [Elusimicrobiaceae bacterium]